MLDGRQPGDRIKSPNSSGEFIFLTCNGAVQPPRRSVAEAEDEHVIQAYATLQAPSASRRVISYVGPGPYKNWAPGSTDSSAFAAMRPASASLQA